MTNNNNEETITISLKESTWKMINARKNKGDTHDSIIKSALLEVPEVKSHSPSRPHHPGKESSQVTEGSLNSPALHHNPKGGKSK